MTGATIAVLVSRQHRRDSNQLGASPNPRRPQQAPVVGNATCPEQHYYGSRLAAPGWTRQDQHPVMIASDVLVIGTEHMAAGVGEWGTRDSGVSAAGRVIPPPRHRPIEPAHVDGDAPDRGHIHEA